MGYKERLQRSIELLRMYAGQTYNLYTSGGKDSDVIEHLAKRAGVKFRLIHKITTIGYPEQIAHLKTKGNIEFIKPNKNFYQLVIKNKMPPFRQQRWCCRELKEHNEVGEFKILGIRKWESSNRSKNRRETETCITESTRTLNPIFDWQENDIWRYIDDNNLNYCSLYDNGYNRVGCMFCPFKPNRIRKLDAERYPRYRKLFIKTFDEVIRIRKLEGKKCTWKDGKELFEWWLDG